MWGSCTQAGSDPYFLSSVTLPVPSSITAFSSTQLSVRTLLAVGTSLPEGFVSSRTRKKQLLTKDRSGQGDKHVFACGASEVCSVLTELWPAPWSLAG